MNDVIEKAREILELDECATDAPWWVDREHEEDSHHHGYRAHILKHRWDDVPTWIAESSDRAEAGDDFAFIAFVRNHAASLARAVIEQHAEIERLKKVIADYSKQIIEQRNLISTSQAAAGQPLAWAVAMPTGCESDYEIVPEEQDARERSAEVADSHELDEFPAIIPLHALPLAEIERLKKDCDEKDAAIGAMGKGIADARDAILHERGAMAENGMNSDQVNDVLSEFDQYTHPALSSPPLAAVMKRMEDGERAKELLNWAVGYINAQSMMSGYKRGQNAAIDGVLDWLDKTDAVLESPDSGFGRKRAIAHADAAVTAALASAPATEAVTSDNETTTKEK